jgi:hypothetical protein
MQEVGQTFLSAVAATPCDRAFSGWARTADRNVRPTVRLTRVLLYLPQVRLLPSRLASYSR